MLGVRRPQRIIILVDKSMEDFVQTLQHRFAIGGPLLPGNGNKLGLCTNCEEHTKDSQRD